MKIIDSIPFKIVAVATAITAIGVVAFAVRSHDEPQPQAQQIQRIERVEHQPSPPPPLKHPVEVQPQPGPPA